jgi:hypothetical protein
VAQEDDMNYAKVLAHGVGSWVQFEQACSRSSLFEEKYLIHPIGQILGARTGARVLTEYNHPILAPLMHGAGRRPAIDFAIRDPKPKISVAVESKWIGRTKVSVESILWDLIRLELIAHYEKAKCYFVLGGKRRDLEALFNVSTFSDSETVRYPKPLLWHEHNALHRVSLVPTVRVRIPMLKRLFKDYQDLEFPQFLVTQRSAPFPATQIANGFQVYVWQVMSAGRRDTFVPRNSRHYFDA